MKIGIVIFLILLVVTVSIILIYNKSQSTGKVILNTNHTNSSLNYSKTIPRVEVLETNLSCNHETYTQNMPFHSFNMTLVTGEVIETEVENTPVGTYLTLTDSNKDQKTITKFLNGNCISKILIKNISI